MTPKQIYEALQQDPRAMFIDVRTPVEFREVHAQGAELIPLDQLDAGKVIESLDGDYGKPIYLICRTGSRSKQALEKIKAAGYENIVCVEGGTQAWVEAGLPVVRGKKAISLERQVRIGAGSLVLLGVALGWFIHPVFLLICAFVGGGLVFAGVTDRCGMAILLGKMPWNRVGEACPDTRTSPSAQT